MDMTCTARLIVSPRPSTTRDVRRRSGLDISSHEGPGFLFLANETLLFVSDGGPTAAVSQSASKGWRWQDEKRKREAMLDADRLMIVERESQGGAG